MTTTTSTAETATKRLLDARGFWRILLAVMLPLPWLAKGIQYTVAPAAADTTIGQIKIFATDHSYAWLQWLDTVFVILAVPSLATLTWLTRRGAPRLATAAALLTVTGFLAGISRNINDDQLAWVAARKHYNPTVISNLTHDLQANPTAGLGSGLFILGLVFGSLLLGLALWRSRAVPAWAAVAVGLGGITHPFLQFSHVAVGIGLAVLATGCAACSMVLLQMRNDDFDLPPIAAPRP